MLARRTAARLTRAPAARLTRAPARCSSFVSIDGKRVDPAAATVSVFDTTVQRGNGAFEVVRVLEGGSLRAPALHLDRLQRTAGIIGLELPSRSALHAWLAEAARVGAEADAAAGGAGEGAVRLLATRGGASLPVRGLEPLRVSPQIVTCFERLPVRRRPWWPLLRA
jgi:branched-subunit amino acid aminotransferase/4-amino-4-deoxychorismate lyase|eukprot:69440-Prymnesium_polylepis.2